MSYYKGLSLDGQRALVFGGTSGLGRAIALGLAEAGADVVPVSRRIEEVQKAAAAIRALGKKTLEVAADVTLREDVQRVIDVMKGEMGRIDILVNSAGAIKRAPSLEFEDKEWDRIMNVNVRGTWHTCQMVGCVMKDQNYGRIINIASLSSFVSVHEVTAYVASKGAVLQITRNLAAEWAKYGINVNGIAPGVFETPLNREVLKDPSRRMSILTRTPMRRYGELTEIAGAAIFLASPSASFVTGEVIVVDGGFLAQGIGEMPLTQQ
ncbi:MAG: glucose 1-dehydrogenase [Acidobacteria bacterium]|nr:glucose 1-dehydrogenase [Acidobacteriota bacterium]